METKTTGIQMGLLGERFNGPIAGSETKTLFDVAPEPEDPKCDAIDARISRKFKNTKSGELFPTEGRLP